MLDNAGSQSMKKERRITAQSTSFIRHGLDHMVLAKKAYDKNTKREPIAEPENFNASAAIVDLLIFLESDFNRIGYLRSKEDPNFSYDLIKNHWEEKVAKIFPKCPRNLMEAMEEIRQTRHAIVHAHIWIEEWDFAKDYEFVKRHFYRTDVLRGFRQGFKDVVDFKTFRTKKCCFNIIPTAVNFIDGLKSLLLIEKIVNDLQEEYGKLNIKGYLGPIHLLDKLSKQYAHSVGFHFHDGSLEDWIDLLSINTYEMDKQEIEDFRKFIVRDSC